MREKSSFEQVQRSRRLKNEGKKKERIREEKEMEMVSEAHLPR